MAPARVRPGLPLMKTCSISVEPMPSSISTENVDVNRSNSAAGNASPAETHARTLAKASGGRSALASAA